MEKALRVYEIICHINGISKDEFFDTIEKVSRQQNSKNCLHITPPKIPPMGNIAPTKSEKEQEEQKKAWAAMGIYIEQQNKKESIFNGAWKILEHLEILHAKNKFSILGTWKDVFYTRLIITLEEAMQLPDMKELQKVFNWSMVGTPELVEVNAPYCSKTVEKMQTEPKNTAGSKKDTVRIEATASACKELFAELEQNPKLTQQDITKPAITEMLKERLGTSFHRNEFEKVQWKNRPEKLKEVSGRPKQDK